MSELDLNKFMKAMQGLDKSIEFNTLDEFLETMKQFELKGENNAKKSK
jgi:hypothetical protein